MGGGRHRGEGRGGRRSSRGRRAEASESSESEPASEDVTAAAMAARGVEGRAFATAATDPAAAAGSSAVPPSAAAAAAAAVATPTVAATVGALPAGASGVSKGLNASPYQELREESGVAVIGRGRGFSHRDDEVGPTSRSTAVRRPKRA